MLNTFTVNFIPCPKKALVVLISSLHYIYMPIIPLLLTLKHTVLGRSISLILVI